MKLLRDTAVVAVGAVLGLLVARIAFPPTVPGGDVDLGAPFLWIAGGGAGAIVAGIVLAFHERAAR